MLRKALVHRKDKVEKENTCGVVYKIPCHNYELVYIDEMGRKNNTRASEHRKDAKMYHRYTQGQSESNLKQVLTTTTTKKQQQKKKTTKQKKTTTKKQ